MVYRESSPSRLPILERLLSLAVRKLCARPHRQLFLMIRSQYITIALCKGRLLIRIAILTGVRHLLWLLVDRGPLLAVCLVVYYPLIINLRILAVVIPTLYIVFL